MAIVFTELDGAATGTDGSTIVSNAFNVTINVPFILFVGNTKGTAVDAGTPTDNAAGGTNTYTSVKAKSWHSTAASLKRMQSWVVIPKATESITITVTFGGNTQTGLFYSVIQCAGANPSGTVVQSQQCSNANADTSAANADGDVTMNAFADPVSNGLLYFAGTAANSNFATALTEIRDNTISAPAAGWLVAYQIGENLTPTCSWTGSVSHYEQGIEIKAAAADPGTVVGQSTRLRTMIRRRRS